MMPVAPTPKKSSSFTIESLVGKDSGNSSKSSPDTASSPPGRSSPDDGGTPTSASAPRAAILGGLHSSFHPVTPGLMPNGLKNIFPEVPFPLDSLPPQFHGHFNGQLGLPAHLGSAGLPPHHQHGLPSPLHPLFMGANRENFHFYPWLVSRNGGYLNHRFAGPEAGLLLQPFRKPKRIRTAFSPSQLLRLEHAFEKNHYVVGQERKELAANLSLTETQVKVWFQNRRTKYKRLKAEEAETHGGKEAGEGHHVTMDDSREEDDMDDEAGEMEEEEEDEEIDLGGDHCGVASPAPGGSNSCSPGTTDVSTEQILKTSHHLNRWRVETNLV